MRTYRHWWPFPGAIVLIIIGSLIATAPLWQTTGLPNSDDSLTHIFNLLQLDQEIAAGEWYPLRFPAAGLGYGYAVLAYYPPLAYYGVELIRLFGADLVLAYKVGLTLITVLAGLTTFALGVALTDAYGGLLIAFLYLFSPYLLATLHERGALAEQLGLALGPLLLLAIDRTVQQPGWRSYLLTSFTIALLILSHFVSTLLFLPLAALYGLWLLSRASAPKRWRGAGVLAVASVTGTALSAFYWLPAAVESAGRRVFDRQAMLAAYLAELMPVTSLLRPSWLIRYENRHAIPELGAPFLLLLVITLLLFVSPLFRQQRGATWAFFAGVGVLGLLSVTVVAVPVWRTLPALALLQFPFRWLGPACLACAIAIGGALWAAFPSRSHYASWLAGGGILLLLGWYGYATLYHLPTQPAMLRSVGIDQVTASAINESGLRAYEYDLADNAREQCWFWAYEYIPATSSLSNCETMRDTILQSPPITSALPAVAAQLQPRWFTPNELVAQVTASHPWQLTLHAFWLPGWQATIDQQPVSPTAVAPLGVVGLAVPAGVHEVRLHYGPTPLRLVLRWVALILWLGWARVALCVTPRLTGAALVGVALAGALFWQHGTSTNGQPPWQPLNVNFNHIIALQGFRVAQEGEQLQLALAWLAQQPTPQSYKVFVHVIDDTGTLWTQADSRPIAYASNTNRWLPGQVILDQHSLPLPAAMPTGRYQVRVGLYAEQDGQRLPVVNEQGVAVDDQLLLDYVTVQR